jgi:hypothetical protein
MQNIAQSCQSEAARIRSATYTTLVTRVKVRTNGGAGGSRWFQFEEEVKRSFPSIRPPRGPPQAKAGGKDLICDRIFRTSVLPQVRKTFYKARSSSGDILSILLGLFLPPVSLSPSSHSGNANSG